jgi:hypothetical protein
MHHASGDSGSRDASGGVRRRLFSRREPDSGLDPALESEVRAAHHAILTRFERGLADIEANARAVLREAAEDTWQGTEEELKQLREQITRDLSRDQAIRGLISHADERYQSLDVRVGRIEENLSSVERAAQVLTEAIGDATFEGGPDPAGLPVMETRLAAVEVGLDAVREASVRIEENLASVEHAAQVLTEAIGDAANADGGSEAPDLAPLEGRLGAVEAGLERVRESSHRIEEQLGKVERATQSLGESFVVAAAQGTSADAPDLAPLGGRLAAVEAGLDAVRESSRRIEENLANVERATQSLSESFEEALTREGPSESTDLTPLEGRLAAVETGLDAVRQSSRRLQDGLDLGLAEVTALIAELVHRPADGEGDGDGATTTAIDLRPVALRLGAVQDYLGQVVEYLSDRDQALVEWMEGVARHTDGVVAVEAARVEEALSGRLDMAALETEGRVREAVTHQLESIHERLQQHAQLLGEALAVAETKTLARLQDQDGRLADHTERLEAVRAQIDAVRAAAVETAERVSVALHERLADLADQMRAESEDMRFRLVDKAREAGAGATRDIDERLGRLAELVQAALGWSVDEIDRRIHQEILRAVAVGMADFLALMDRRFVDLNASMDERITFLSRHMSGHIELIEQHMDERLELTDRAMQAGLGALEESVTERATAAIDQALESRIPPATAELERTVEAARAMLEATVVGTVGERAAETARILDERAEAATRMLDDRTAGISRQIEERAEATARLIEERTASTAQLIEERTAAAARTLEDAVTRTLADRMAALAQLIRSDNTALADQLSVIEEQAAAKEAIRAIKELAAAMPQEISEAMDERLAVLGELFRRENRHTVDTVSRAATALADRLDKTAVVIGDRFDRDVEVVVDQIGSTMQTLASGLQRSTGRVNRQA